MPGANNAAVVQRQLRLIAVHFSPSPSLAGRAEGRAAKSDGEPMGPDA